MGFESTVTVVSLVISLAAGIAAFWSAGEARAANKRADRANNIAREANKNAEKANSIAVEANEISNQALEQQKLQAPPIWSELIKAENHSYRLENKSGRDVEILGITTDSEEARRFIRVGKLPVQVSYGDGYQIRILKTWQVTVLSINIQWRFLDDPSAKIQTTKRLVN